MINVASKPDPARVMLWGQFADQFLDTETRTWLPATALAALEAGYSLGEARNIWRYEVAPAVCFNVWDIAGEWAGWPSEWLIPRIEKLRGRWPNRPGLVSAAIYRMRVHFLEGSWRGIADCYRLLADTPPEQRQRLCADLTLLAEIFFDFCARMHQRPSPDRLEQLAAVYREAFLPIFARQVVNDTITKEKPSECRRRVESWLASAPSTAPAGARRSAPL